MSGAGRDHHDEAPGRIPESLIHAALDGEVCDDMQREIADALRYDKSRHRELLDTADAIRALRSEVDAPDFASVVLGKLDRQNRFIPASWQRHVRVGRMGVAAALLLSLVCVAGLQRMYPRLSTFGAQSTPVRDIAQAVETEALQAGQSIRDEVRMARATMIRSMIPSIGPRDLRTPGRTDHVYTISIDQRGPRWGGRHQTMMLPSGYLIYVPDGPSGLNGRVQVRSLVGTPAVSTVSTVSWTRSGLTTSVIGATPGQGLCNGVDTKDTKEAKALELP